MSPDQKSNLVEDLQNLGLYVGMCGDGANDCGALRTAHAGISLSEAEASVASPFTSKTANISCVPNVIREGRAALVTSCGVFKYMALYSIVQFVTIIILYTSNSSLSDGMFLYIDLFITTVVAVFMGHTGAYKTLVKKRPSSSLVSVPNITSLLLHIAIIIGVQALVYVYLSHQPWYVVQISSCSVRRGGSAQVCEQQTRSSALMTSRSSSQIQRK
jgi:cation-transporting ATPase 13A2